MPEPYVVADEPAVRLENVNSTDENGGEIDVEGYVIPIVVPLENVAELLANYDPSREASPLVEYSRPLARAILDALRLKVG